MNPTVHIASGACYIEFQISIFTWSLSLISFLITSSVHFLSLFAFHHPRHFPSQDSRRWQTLRIFNLLFVTMEQEWLRPDLLEMMPHVLCFPAL
ncbi:hypothetical protein VNO78_14729 [Psophocarpus tetragonolobus]|uniref:Uncharacterized protein n=1 Tax=Psophocarpus tetragonolobus TaxID=3891 RepID=A0AAN9SDL3_PSOTE